MAEAVLVLQPIAQSAIDPDVGEPDDRDRDGRRSVGRHADDEEGERGDGRVQEVVGGRADPRVGDVSEHPEVGSEQ
jgi:hypothetical protein